MIHAAAIKHNGAIYTLPRPARHFDIFFKLLVPIVPKLNYDEAQRGAGFLTDTGEFVNRLKGYHVAVMAGQIPDDGAMGHNLYTEMVW